MRYLLSPDTSGGGSPPRPDVRRDPDRVIPGQSTSADSIMANPDAGGDNASAAGQTRGTGGKVAIGGLEGDRNIEQNRGNGGSPGATGDNVLSTGRPTQSDAPSGIGAAAVSGATEALQSEAGHRRPGGEISTSPLRQTDRPADLVEGRAAGPDGTLAGSPPNPDTDATGQAAEDADEEWRGAGGQAVRS